MMKKPVFYLLLSIITLASCATEKFNVSPLSASLSTGTNRSGSIEDVMGGTLANNINASEITNLIATFPKFRNDAVNKEVLILKDHLKNYLFAYEAYNIAGKNRSLQDIQQSYRKIQKLRKYLNSDEDEIVNRYLVRIKTNLSVLETPGNPTP